MRAELVYPVETSVEFRLIDSTARWVSAKRLVVRLVVVIPVTLFIIVPQACKYVAKATYLELADALKH